MSSFDRVMANVVMIAFAAPLAVVAVRLLLAYLRGGSI